MSSSQEFSQNTSAFAADYSALPTAPAIPLDTATAALHANAHTFVKDDDSMDDSDDYEPTQIYIQLTNVFFNMVVDNISHSTFIFPPPPPPPQDTTHFFMDCWIPLLNQIAGPEIYYQPTDVWTPGSVQNAIDHCKVLVYLMQELMTELNATVLHKDATILEMHATIQQLRSDLESKDVDIQMQDDIIESLGGMPLYKWN